MVFVLSIFFFSLISVDGYFNRLGVRLLLLPIIAGLSYEFLRFAGKNFNNALVKIIVWPGLMLQKITTREPEDHMIEVAIKALQTVL
jgi:uncharacterized protein YqhQ